MAQKPQIMSDPMQFPPWLNDMSSSRREERPMRKLSGSCWRFVAERVSLVRALREAKAVARLVSTSKCEKTHSVIVRDGTLM